MVEWRGVTGTHALPISIWDLKFKLIKTEPRWCFLPLVKKQPANILRI